MASGGGGSTTSTVNQSNLPAYARPYYESLMERGAKESTRDYTPYKGDRIAEMSGDTLSGLQSARSYGASGTPLLDAAGNAVRGVASQAGQLSDYDTSNYKARTLNYGDSGIRRINSMTVGNERVGFGQGGIDRVTNQTVTGQNVGFGQGGYNPLAYGGDIQQVGAGQFGQAAAQQYMSPYMEAVTNKAQQDAIQNAAEAQATRNLQAARSGSFGGSRAAVQNQMAQNALQSNMTDIMVRGQQSAFENAQSQFNADQQRAMQAAIQNQQTGLSMGQQNQQSALQALLANQDVGMKGALANQQANLAAQQANQQTGVSMGLANQEARLKASLANQQANLAAQQANQQTGLTMGQSNQQALLDAARLREQSRQFGGSLGLQGLELQGKAGMDLASLQTQRDDAMLNRIKSQLGVGSTLEDYKQQRLDQRYADFVNQRDAERQNLQFLSSLLQGVPVSANQDVTTTTPQNNLQGMLGTAGGLQALYSLGSK